MITLNLNHKEYFYEGNPTKSLLSWLRDDMKITSVKDGCSGEGICGTCTVEINGKARPSCRVTMQQTDGMQIITIEGLDKYVKETITGAFVKAGAVQCGFCTCGFIIRTNVLLKNNPSPNEDEIKKALKPNLCRCTGYVKIIEAVKYAAKLIKNKQHVPPNTEPALAGFSFPKYQALDTALGKRNFVDDIQINEILHAALLFCEYPRAKINNIDYTQAQKIDGVIRIFTAKDIPGNKNTGLIFNDWPLMIDIGQTTHYIGDVIAGVVAINEETARHAASLIDIDYEILTPVTTITDALEDNICVHENKSNILDSCVLKKGVIEDDFSKYSFFTSGTFNTQRIEHAFLETECSIGVPTKKGVKLFSQGQGIYVDRRQIASLLNLPETDVEVELVPNGGGFGGKEDLTVQGHTALFAYLLQKSVKLKLTRSESIRMHPKRHPVEMRVELACNVSGQLTALRVFAHGDTGAYASVGNKVMERLAGHASGGYFIPNIFVDAKTIYTNNIPCGAMRGFGVNQINFALEQCIDDLCKQGKFDRWQFRYDNALTDGLSTATGQILSNTGIRKCLLALRDDYLKAKFVGLAIGIKNSGVGNGMADFCDVEIEIISENKITIRHGWTEMGQGVQNVAIQIFCNETGLNPNTIEIENNTKSNLITGMTTSSRATALVGNAIIDASKKIRHALSINSFTELIGKMFTGRFCFDKSTKPGDTTKEIITHFSYGYAAQLCVLNEQGQIDTIYAAHDAGKVINPALFEGQIEGAVVMGIGYALSENLEMKDGLLVSDKLNDCKIPRITDIPKIVVYAIEQPDAIGPYGAKGIGEIGLVPTAGAIANAFTSFDNKRRFSLPMEKTKNE